MAIIIDMKNYRVETYRAPHALGQTRELPTPTVRIVRKADDAFIELDLVGGPLAYELLWEVAHGEAGVAQYVQEWIDYFEADWGEECWKKEMAEA
jgi:hypothetical protein